MKLMLFHIVRAIDEVLHLSTPTIGCIENLVEGRATVSMLAHGVIIRSLHELVVVMKLGMLLCTTSMGYRAIDCIVVLLFQAIAPMFKS